MEVSHHRAPPTPNLLSTAKLQCATTNGLPHKKLSKEQIIPSSVRLVSPGDGKRGSLAILSPARNADDLSLCFELAVGYLLSQKQPLTSSPQLQFRYRDANGHVQLTARELDLVVFGDRLRPTHMLELKVVSSLEGTSGNTTLRKAANQIACSMKVASLAWPDIAGGVIVVLLGDVNRIGNTELASKVVPLDHLGRVLAQCQTCPHQEESFYPSSKAVAGVVEAGAVLKKLESNSLAEIFFPAGLRCRIEARPS
jgi:hypothetical protein